VAGERDEKQDKALRQAAELVTQAMDLLDAHGASPISAAHLAIALKNIKDDLGQ
jgi:hypothetical protein